LHTHHILVLTAGLHVTVEVSRTKTKINLVYCCLQNMKNDPFILASRWRRI